MAKGTVNRVIILGRLGQDPEARSTANGTQVVNLNVATNELGRADEQGNRPDLTEWHRIVLFGRMAENAAQYLKKGSQVYIEGRVQTRKWQDQSGQDRYSTDIIANDRSRRVQIHAASDPRPFLYFLLLFLSLLVPPRLLLPKRNLRRRRAHRRLPHPASKKRAANATRVRFRRRPEIRVRVRLRVGVRGRRLLLRKSNDLSQLTLESANVSVRAR